MDCSYLGEFLQVDVIGDVGIGEEDAHLVVRSEQMLVAPEPQMVPAALPD